MPTKDRLDGDSPSPLHRRSESLPALVQADSADRAAAQPGSCWVWRGGAGGKAQLARAGKTVAKPPLNEAAAVAWKASRKETLQGQLGTGNKISSVIQYPISTKDPLNQCRGSRRHLSAEDRRLLRVLVKHHMKKRPGYPDSVYLVEEALIKGFSESPELRETFFASEVYAAKVLEGAAASLQNRTSPPAAGSASDGSATAERELRPSHHGPYCGPQCYCLMYQDAALTTKVQRTPGDFHESFANTAKSAVQSVHRSLAAS